MPFGISKDGGQSDIAEINKARPFLGGALIAKEREIDDGVLAEVKRAFEK